MKIYLIRLWEGQSASHPPTIHIEPPTHWPGHLNGSCPRATAPRRCSMCLCWAWVYHSDHVTCVCHQHFFIFIHLGWRGSIEGAIEGSLGGESALETYREVPRLIMKWFLLTLRRFAWVVISCSGCFELSASASASAFCFCFQRRRQLRIINPLPTNWHWTDTNTHTSTHALTSSPSVWLGRVPRNSISCNSIKV